MFQSAQLPKVSINPERINNINKPDENLLFNSSVDYNLNIPSLPAVPSAEVSHYYVRPSEGKHPLTKYSSPPKYVQGYYDPSFESLEYDKLEFRGNLPRSIRSNERDNYNVMVHCENTLPDKFARHDDRSYHYHRYELNDSVKGGKIYDSAYDTTHEANRYSLNNTGTNMAYAHRINDPNIHAPWNQNNDVSFPYTNSNILRPTKPEKIGYDMIDLDDVPVYRTPTKQRAPAGLVFSNESIKQLQSNFETNFAQNNTEVIKEVVEKFGISNCSSTGSENSFENPIAKEADYMYMTALKVRANAVCSYLQNNVSYKTWSDNWRLLESNLRGGQLFERLDDTDADIAYVVNKGEEIKFRIRDKKKYVPINTYQYVLYHEMAHMSTTEKQHTPFFCKLLNIITLAGFECGFIDLSKFPYGYYTTNGAPILSKSSMKEEIIDGANHLKEVNSASVRYYDGLIKAVQNA